MDINFLKGKKIGITALDLEQMEHRGIAAVTKSLIKLLSKYGAEIYLITSLGSKRSGIIGEAFIKKKLLELSSLLTVTITKKLRRRHWKIIYPNQLKIMFLLSMQLIKN